MTQNKQTKRFQAKLGGLSCSFCASTLEKAFDKKEGVKKAAVSLAHNEILVEYEPEKQTPDKIKKTIKELGYTVRDPNKVKAFEEQQAEIKQKKKKLFFAASLTCAALIIMILMWTGFFQAWMYLVMPALALITVFGPGFFILKMAYQSLRRGILNQHVLLELGAFSGLAGGFIGFFVPNFPIAEFFGVSVFITTYHILSDFTSLKVRTKASQAVQNLLKLQPDSANIVRDGKEEEIPVEELHKDDVIRIRPGDRIPVDGEVINGSSTVDESIVTGESMPVEKIIGSEVTGGSFNKQGTLLVKVTHLGDESFLQKVVHNIEEARALKPGIILLVDKILKYYVPGVLIFSGISILIWTVGDYFVTGHIDIVRGIFAALAVFVMGYPCALGMATPLAMIHGGGIAAQKGILIRSSVAFQALKDAKIIVFDKTGTITKGKPAVIDIIPFNNSSEDELIKIAASVEVPSEHPIGQAIVQYAQKNNLEIKETENFEALSGLGVKGSLNENEILVGSLNFLNENGISTGEINDKAEELTNKAKTVLGISKNNKIIGLITIADEIKADAKETITRLKEMGLEPIMITGDNQKTAEQVAKQAGIEKVFAEVLPNKKLYNIRRLQSPKYKVIMVGDGINDAPALMQSDVGIAIGTGTDIAIESADVVIMGDKLSAVPELYFIGKNSYKKTVQNLSLAFFFNGIGIPLAVTGLISPVWAMIAMAASVSAVLINSFGLNFEHKKNGKKTLRFKVENMHCENCINTIKKALNENLEDVTIKVDLENKIIEVNYINTNVSAEGVVEIIVDKGYKPELIDE